MGLFAERRNPEEQIFKMFHALQKYFETTDKLHQNNQVLPCVWFVELRYILKRWKQREKERDFLLLEFFLLILTPILQDFIKVILIPTTYMHFGLRIIQGPFISIAKVLGS